MGWNGRTLAVLGALGAVAFVVLAGPVGSIAWSGVPYGVVGVFCCVATVVGIRRHRPRHAAAWWWVAASHAVWSLADTAYYVLAAFGDTTFPTVADALYVLGYVPLLVGVALLVRRARPNGQLGGLVDGAVVATGLGLLGWVLFVGPVVAGRGDDALSHLVGGVYLGSDVVLVALAAHLVASSVRLSRSAWLALAAIALLLVGDSTYVWGAVLPGWAFTALSLGWLLSNVAWSAAALHPSMADLSDREAPAASGMTPRRTGVLLVAVLLAPATLAVMQLLDLEADYAVALASAVMSVFVVLRMGMALRAAAASLLAREEMRRALEHQATHDPLTGLANRAASTEHLARALAAARAGRAHVALLFVDLDGFKGVNDAHGHRAGDDVLREVAHRLAAAVRDGDVAGRLGGDEFVLVLTDVRDVEDVLAVAQRVVQGVAEPIVADGHLVTVGASIGAAVSDTASEPAALIHEADTAAYRAKARGRGRVELYDHALRAADAEVTAAEAELRAAWPVEGLVLDLSPVLPPPPAAPWPAPVALAGQVRWQRRSGRDLEHAALVAAAERAGRTGDLGRWGLHEALRQQRAAGPSAPPVWVPLLAAHVAGTHVVDDVAEAVSAHGAAGGALAVRTCGPSALATPASLAHLRELRSAGVGVVLEGLTAQGTALGELHAVPATALLLRSGDLPEESLLVLFTRSARALGLDVVLDGPPRAEVAPAVQALGLPVVQQTSGVRLPAPR
ncbi:diguanylate cyclase [Streptomyces sp. NP160]|uniref:GGDEF domain-containing protein n=1 Tax=Streptomyces sp. NP160 TaxID=2586637 RepID=UPI001117C9EF|nr:diguanylate cyclase [Streptomyces sp. NP160]TNM59693.1 diguanylate cyclase [Streptomyces sp. NP160]